MTNTNTTDKDKEKDIDEDVQGVPKKIIIKSINNVYSANHVSQKQTEKAKAA